MFLNCLKFLYYTNGESEGTLSMKLASKIKILKYHLLSLYAVVHLYIKNGISNQLFCFSDYQDCIDGIFKKNTPNQDLLNSEEINQLWLERYFPKAYDIDELLKLPFHTLGFAYATHMKKYNFKSDFFLLGRGLQGKDLSQVFKSKTKYIRFRLSQTHDIWHVLTGFDTSVIGEAGIEGFYFGQFYSGYYAALFVLTLTAALLRRQFDSFEKAVEFFFHGMQNGRQSKFLLTVKWECHWADDLEEVRKMYNINSVSYDINIIKELSARK